jgi:hypothetical protein
VSVLVVLGKQKFQTHISNVPFAKLPQWTGQYSSYAFSFAIFRPFYALLFTCRELCCVVRSADNSYRPVVNELEVSYADSELQFFVLGTRLARGAKPAQFEVIGTPVTLAAGAVSLATLRAATGVHFHFILTDLLPSYSESINLHPLVVVLRQSTTFW